jgi:hypothetical protein
MHNSSPSRCFSDSVDDIWIAFFLIKANPICIRLGHESLNAALAHLKGKDAESEEAQEHANSSSLAV